VRSPIGISRVYLVEPPGTRPDGCGRNPEESHPRSRKALRSSADSIRWLPRSSSAAASRRRIASEILVGAQPGAAAKALRPVAACMKARFPIALQQHGLSAYLFYAGAKYERNWRIVDTFDNVRAAAPVLEEGIELLKSGNEPGHQSIHTP
jgi:hypothetical protein